MEELTSDIPNVSEEATKDLDENGIVRVGARIEPVSYTHLLSTSVVRIHLCPHFLRLERSLVFADFRKWNQGNQSC